MATKAKTKIKIKNIKIPVNINEGPKLQKLMLTSQFKLQNFLNNKI